MRVSLACLRLGRSNNPWCLRTSQSELVRGFSCPLQTTTSAGETSSHQVNSLDHIFMHLGEPGIMSDLYQPPKLKNSNQMCEK